MQRLSIAILFNLVDFSISVNDERGFVQIPCPVNVEKGLQYRKITWYKVEEGSETLTGLVMKDLHRHVTILYKFANKSYEVGDDYSLLLPEAGKRDCGHYHCTLWPPLGHYIQEGDYEFYPLDCTKPLQQSKFVTGEKTGSHLNNIPLLLAITGVFFVTTGLIISLCCKKLMHDKMEKQATGNVWTYDAKKIFIF